MANNSAIASMGYGLPAAIGTCIGGSRRNTICLEGDGSIMMNLQELQTILTNKLPIKIFLINNNGYHSMNLHRIICLRSIARLESDRNQEIYHSLSSRRLQRLSDINTTVLHLMKR